MAVDTAAKRKSALSFSSLGDLLFTPTGTVGAASRASALDLYEGISLASNATVLGQISITGVLSTQQSITGVLSTQKNITGSLSTQINITGTV